MGVRPVGAPSDTAPVRRLVLTIPVALLLLAGCGTPTVKPDGAERSVRDVVARQTGFRPKDVSCPSGVDAKAGTTFDCHFTGPEPKPYVAHVRITKVEGERVVFYVRTRPE